MYKRNIFVLRRPKPKFWANTRNIPYSKANNGKKELQCTSNAYNLQKTKASSGQTNEDANLEYNSRKGGNRVIFH